MGGMHAKKMSSGHGENGRRLERLRAGCEFMVGSRFSILLAELLHGKPLDAHRLELANATLAPRGGELLLDGFDAFDVGQQYPATIIFGGQHDAVTPWVQLRRRGDFLQRENHADLEAQMLQFVGANRRKTPIKEGGIARDVPRFLGGVRKVGCQRADAAAQLPSRTADGNKDAVPLAQDTFGGEGRLSRIAAERGFDRTPRDLRKHLSGFLLHNFNSLPSPIFSQYPNEAT